MMELWQRMTIFAPGMKKGIIIVTYWLAAIFLTAVLLTLQVRSEEKRLEADFGDAYRAYKQSVRRYL